MERIHKIQKIQKMHTNVEMCIGGGMVWQVGGHGAELMINIALASMHVILYIDILGPTFVMRGGGHGPPAPPPRSAAYDVYWYKHTWTMATFMIMNNMHVSTVRTNLIPLLNARC